MAHKLCDDGSLDVLPLLPPSPPRIYFIRNHDGTHRTYEFAKFFSPKIFGKFLIPLRLTYYLVQDAFTS